MDDIELSMSRLTSSKVSDGELSLLSRIFLQKSDLVAKSRKLRHEGVLSWRNAREKEVETLVVVLSDVILFLQENDKKYSFFTQDSKVRARAIQDG